MHVAFPSLLSILLVIAVHLGHFTTWSESFSGSPAPSGKQPPQWHRLTSPALASLFFYANFMLQRNGCIFLPSERYILYFLASLPPLYHFPA